MFRTDLPFAMAQTESLISHRPHLLLVFLISLSKTSLSPSLTASNLGLSLDSSSSLTSMQFMSMHYRLPRVLQIGVSSCTICQHLPTLFDTLWISCLLSCPLTGKDLWEYSSDHMHQYASFHDKAILFVSAQRTRCSLSSDRSPLPSSGTLPAMLSHVVSTRQTSHCYRPSPSDLYMKDSFPSLLSLSRCHLSGRAAFTDT